MYPDTSLPSKQSIWFIEIIPTLSPQFKSRLRFSPSSFKIIDFSMNPIVITDSSISVVAEVEYQMFSSLIRREQCRLEQYICFSYVIVVIICVFIILYCL